ncbi:unnamed protein product [Prorocentrum cordatum]|uniref:Uncharacterized protein n=1 Tax=Prorocentrum cordatum TaxID=2364126 RepID=A0ABN9WZG5_9DINO|nr:unnamed protein product [Polarella glacialis]
MRSVAMLAQAFVLLELLSLKRCRSRVPRPITVAPIASCSTAGPGMSHELSEQRAKHPAEQRTQSTLLPGPEREDLPDCSSTGTALQSQVVCMPCGAAPLGTACARGALGEQWLQAAAELPLEAAARLLRVVDVDLADELGRVSSLLRRVVVDTASVLASSGRAARGIADGALPMLRAALASSRAKRTAVANSVGIAQGLVLEPRDEAAQVLDSYVLLIERVHYVHRCLLVTIDSHGAEGDAGVGAEAMEGLREGKAGFSQDGAGPSGHGVGEALGIALVHLDEAIDALEECSDRWRMLRRTERLLASVAECAQDIRGRLLSGPRIFDIQPGFEPFVASLEQLCELCCPRDSAAAPGPQHVLRSQGADAEVGPRVSDGSCGFETASSLARSRPRSWLLSDA